MGNSPSSDVEEPERRAPALREATDSTDQGAEHEEEAAYKYREYRCVSMLQQQTAAQVSIVSCPDRTPHPQVGEVWSGHKTIVSTALQSIVLDVENMSQNRLFDCSSPATPPSTRPHPPPSSTLKESQW